MAEVLFYRLSESPVEAALPGLLGRSLERGWRVLLRIGADAGLAFLDERLWTFRDDTFLPHGVAGGRHDASQPVLLTRGSDNANAANVLMLVMGARAGVDEMARYDRACLFFEAGDAAAVETARDDWRAVVAAGLPAKYWAEEGGRWVLKASGGAAQ
ncbi:DNA polymerase III subunit chi [Amaricoccus sp.]|uniref:DNA polymerase III subunit chi n=1 Tax=Amaricoccus sp. TaxID=1872485 RepID=UPI001B6518A2|nr:DNA polymerase III subunit chi [Amaricoccus sp.]MBP7002843.1 DNA polymerase III subunit chi [Amaricoccus sp.]